MKATHTKRIGQELRRTSAWPAKAGLIALQRIASVIRGDENVISAIYSDPAESVLIATDQHLLQLSLPLLTISDKLSYDSITEFSLQQTASGPALWLTTPLAQLLVRCRQDSATERFVNYVQQHRLGRRVRQQATRSAALRLDRRTAAFLRSHHSCQVAVYGISDGAPPFAAEYVLGRDNVIRLLSSEPELLRTAQTRRGVGLLIGCRQCRHALRLQGHLQPEFNSETVREPPAQRLVTLRLVPQAMHFTKLPLADAAAQLPPDRRVLPA